MVHPKIPLLNSASEEMMLGLELVSNCLDSLRNSLKCVSLSTLSLKCLYCALVTLWGLEAPLPVLAG